VSKHRKIAIVLHSINGLLMVLLGFIIFTVSGAFTSCSASAIAQNSSFCIYSSLFFFGIPLTLSLLTIIALVNFGKVAKIFLWTYSIIIAVLFIPIGSAIGGHTIYLLSDSAKATTH